MRIPFLSPNSDIGLLLLRVAIGLLMLFGHGFGKVLAFSERYETFPDPIGFGSPVSMAMAIFAEVFCSTALIVGWKTRLVAVPLFITMLVAAILVHAPDPWQRKELAVVYTATYLTLILAGGGKYALSALQFRSN